MKHEEPKFHITLEELKMQLPIILREVERLGLVPFLSKPEKDRMQILTSKRDRILKEIQKLEVKAK